ncbi:MAG: 3-hydroxybutyryl-CoA dehydrogenase [Desulfuromonadales bacterium]|jgi:3-hydroxybutyryl-CoA dehydrogenase|nr:3-hydroxybutyryl-CoA dehydrogenase [Desulfuromonadales bacterium]
MKLKDIRKVLVVGGGTIGQQIAFQCAAHGYAVTLFDISPDSLRAAKRRIRAYGDYLVAERHIKQETAEKAIEHIVPTSDPGQAAAEADLLSESVPEDPTLKGEVFAQFHRLCPSRTVFTTNTSLLVPSQFAKSTGRPERFLALHFHQPVWVGNLADVMPHSGTSPEVVSLVRDFAKSINQIPLVLQKENYGYVFNAMYSGLNSAAIALAANGVAAVEDIDRAWMAVMKMSVGPLGMLDVVGLDTVWHVTDYWAKHIKDPQTVKNAAFLKREYLDKGWLGVKSGRGFYSYPHPAYQNPTFIHGE